MKILLTLFLAVRVIIFAYFFIGIATVLKNGTSITQSPGTFIRLKTFFTTHIAETSQNSSYPELHSRQYNLSSNITTEIIIESIHSTAKLLDYDVTKQSHHQIDLVKTTPLFKFKDDIRIYLTPEDNTITINARSESRVGRADFGANIANIVNLLSALDKNLSN